MAGEKDENGHIRLHISELTAGHDSWFDGHGNGNGNGCKG